jgi:acetyl-CoA synthetase
VVEQSNIMAYMHQKRFKTFEQLYQWSIDKPQEFWADMAGRLEWFSPWEQVLDDSNKPFYKWFSGARFNIVHNAPTAIRGLMRFGEAWPNRHDLSSLRRTS